MRRKLARGLACLKTSSDDVPSKRRVSGVGFSTDFGYERLRAPRWSFSYYRQS